MSYEQQSSTDENLADENSLPKKTLNKSPKLLLSPASRTNSPGSVLKVSDRENWINQSPVSIGNSKAGAGTPDRQSVSSLQRTYLVVNESSTSGAVDYIVNTVESTDVKLISAADVAIEDTATNLGYTENTAEAIVNISALSLEGNPEEVVFDKQNLIGDQLETAGTSCDDDFLVEELSVKLRKSLTLDDKPLNDLCTGPIAAGAYTDLSEEIAIKTSFTICPVETDVDIDINSAVGAVGSSVGGDLKDTTQDITQQYADITVKSSCKQNTATDSCKENPATELSADRIVDDSVLKPASEQILISNVAGRPSVDTIEQTAAERVLLEGGSVTNDSYNKLAGESLVSAVNDTVLQPLAISVVERLDSFAATCPISNISLIPIVINSSIFNDSQPLIVAIEEDRQVSETAVTASEVKPNLLLEVEADIEALPPDSAYPSSTMTDDFEQQKSPPIASSKGGYSINWDDFDENTNPFQPKKRLSSSPPAAVRSPTLPRDDGQAAEDINPFGASRQLASSPMPKAEVPAGAVGSPAKRPERRSINNNKPELIQDAEVLENSDSRSETSVIQNESKAESCVKTDPDTAPKKKPVTAKSGPRRFKPPAKNNVPTADDEEIQIFAPGATTKTPPTINSTADPKLTKPTKTVTEESYKDSSPTTTDEILDKSNNVPVGEAAVLPPQPSLSTADLSTSIPSALDSKADDKLEKVMVNGSCASGEKGLNEYNVSDCDEQPQEASDEEFYNAVEAFGDPASLDLLEKLGNTVEPSESALSRQSLYVKFDPLVQRRNTPDSQKIKSRINKEFFCATISESDDLLLMGTPPRPITGGAQLKGAVGSAASEASATNSSPLVDKIFACSPPDLTAKPTATDIRAKSVHPVDAGDANDIVQVLKYSQFDVNRLNKEWELDFQARMLAKERDWALQAEQKSREWEKKIADMLLEKQRSDERVKRLQKSHEDIKGVIAEYENTIQKLIAEKETSTQESKGSMTELIKERDQALEDLLSVETAFSDLHRRYEKSKSVLESMKKNEDTLKKCVADYQSKLKRSDEKFQLLKKQAEDKLSEANDEIAKVKRSNESEMAVLQAALRKAEMQAQSLEQTVDQKTKKKKVPTATLR